MFDVFEGMLSNAIRGKPNVPDWQSSTLGDAQTKAISENASALPAAEKLVSANNAFSLGEIQKLMDSISPGWRDIQSKAGAALSSETAGQIPKDVSDAIQRSGAAKAMGGGISGSGAANDLVARDLGLTSLNLIDRGISSAESWMRSSKSIFDPGHMNASSMFVTPGQEAAQSTEERDKRFQYDMGKSLMNWQSSMGYAAAAGLDRDQAQIDQIITEVAGKAGGMALGGI